MTLFFGFRKKRKLGDKILSERVCQYTIIHGGTIQCVYIHYQVRDLVPESQAYMDLLAFERKLDATISRKRLEIQEILRRPMKEKRKLRVFISHHFFTVEPESGGVSTIHSHHSTVNLTLLLVLFFFYFSKVQVYHSGNLNWKECY